MNALLPTPQQARAILASQRCGHTPDMHVKCAGRFHSEVSYSREVMEPVSAYTDLYQIISMHLDSNSRLPHKHLIN